MNDPSRPETAHRAAGALRAFGTNSLPALLAVVDTPGHPCRTTAILSIELMRRHSGPAIEPAAPHLIQCLNPTNGSSIPGWAARALGEFKSSPQLVIPALTNCFSSPNKYLRRTCAEALARIGASAASALPVLTNALADPDPEVCSAARKAISTITALMATNAPAR
jgi:HEAT repeat protein